MQNKFKYTAIALAITSLVSCGGSGGSNPSSPVASLNGAVIDGRIAGASVCLDLNANQACDANEPTTVTDSNGDYTLTTTGLTVGDVTGAHLLVTVPATAKDLDDGGLTIAQMGKSAFTMMAPGNTSGQVLVTPFTTLVSQELKSDPSKTTQDAVDAVTNTLGLPSNTNLFQDPTTGGTLVKNTARAAAAVLGQIQTCLSGGNFTSAQMGALTAQQFRQHFGAITQQANLSGNTSVNITAVIQHANQTLASNNLTTAASTLGTPTNVTTALSGGFYSLNVLGSLGCASPSAAIAASPMMARALNAAPLDNASVTLPTGGIITSGTGTISVNGNMMTITQTTPTLEINWATFDILAGSSVVINQPSSTSRLMNRILTSSNTQIDGGTITANGQVEIISSNGSLLLFSNASLIGNISISAPMNSNLGNITSGTGANVSYLGNTTLTGTSAGSGQGLTFGNGTVTLNGTTITINQAAATLGAKWSNFTISNNTIIVNQQGGGSGISVNRVTGGNNVSVFGGLVTNGNGFVITTNGVNATAPNISVGSTNVSNIGNNICQIDLNKQALSSDKLTESMYGKSGNTWVTKSRTSYTENGNTTVFVNALSPTGWVMPSNISTYTTNQTLAGFAVNDSSFIQTRYTAKSIDIANTPILKVRGLTDAPSFANTTFPSGSSLYWLTEERAQDAYYLYPFLEYFSIAGASYRSFTEFVADHLTANGATRAISPLAAPAGLAFTFDAANSNNITFWRNNAIVGTGTIEYRTVNGVLMLIVNTIPNAGYGDATVSTLMRKSLPLFAFKNGKLYSGNLTPKGSFENVERPYFNKAAIDAIGAKLGWGMVP